MGLDDTLWQVRRIGLIKTRNLELPVTDQREPRVYRDTRLHVLVIDTCRDKLPSIDIGLIIRLLSACC